MGKHKHLLVVNAGYIGIHYVIIVLIFSRCLRTSLTFVRRAQQAEVSVTVRMGGGKEGLKVRLQIWVTVHLPRENQG